MKFIVTAVETSEIPNKKDPQRPYLTQRVWFEPGNGARLPVRMFCPGGRAFQPGEYTLSPESFSVNNYGDLQFRPVLVALARPAAVKPAAA